MLESGAVSRLGPLEGPDRSSRERCLQLSSDRLDVAEPRPARSQPDLQVEKGRRVPFWSSETLQLELPRIIEPYDPARIKHGAYELSLGPELVVSGNHTKSLLEHGEQIAIPAGQFAHLLTEESVTIPNGAIAFISIKSGVKKTGLINVSGFHVDPGFKGRLIFSVYNAGVGSIVLSRGTPTFLIWFASLDHQTADIYDGTHQEQSSLSDADTMTLQGNVASPPTLAIRLDQLDARVSRWFAAIRWIVITLLAAAITTLVKHYVDAQATAKPANVPGLIAPAAPRGTTSLPSPATTKRNLKKPS